MTIKYDRRVHEFIGACVTKYSAFGITLNFSPKRTLSDGTMTYTGCADRESLNIATGRDFEVWFPVFVHETCHLDQAIENLRWFNRVGEALHKLSQWLDGEKNWKEDQLDRIFEQVIALEQDCEQRAVEKIKSYGLPISIKDYSQKANAYLLGYHKTKQNRAWTVSPYSNKKMYNTLPKTLLSFEEIMSRAPGGAEK